MIAITKKTINTATVAIISIVLIILGGILYDIHDHTPAYRRSPLYRPFAIAFSSAGGATLFGMLLAVILPTQLKQTMLEYKV